MEAAACFCPTISHKYFNSLSRVAKKSTKYCVVRIIVRLYTQQIVLFLLFVHPFLLLLSSFLKMTQEPSLTVLWCICCSKNYSIIKDLCIYSHILQQRSGFFFSADSLNNEKKVVCFETSKCRFPRTNISSCA